MLLFCSVERASDVVSGKTHYMAMIGFWFSILRQTTSAFPDDAILDKQMNSCRY